MGDKEGAASLDRGTATAIAGTRSGEGDRNARPKAEGMPRSWWVLALGLVVGVVVSSSVSASPNLQGPGIVRVTNEQLTSKRVDLGAPGLTPGDLLIVTQLVYNRRITTHAIGHEEMLCTYLGRGGVLGGGSRSCQITVYLPEGRIVASGAVHNLVLYSLPVVGGTGIYDNVGGSLTVTQLGGAPRRQLLLFRLTV
jgi:hypothetical protein